MPRRWTSFNKAITDKEALKIPEPDLRRLFKAMKEYRMETGIGYEVEDYGGGLKRIRQSGRTQGRCLFFAEIESKDSVVLVALMFYKKESQRVPTQKLATARQRMNEYRKE